MLNFIDVHTHLCDNKILPNVNAVRQNYLNEGVSIVVDSGCDVITTQICKENASKFSEVYFTSGVHPESANRFNFNDLPIIESLAKDEKCIAVGECGLDYHYDGYLKENQFKLFESLIEMAYKLKKPLVVHSRDACKDTVDILTANKNYLNNGFLMHCYAESLETSKTLLDLGAYFSFGGVVTFKNSKRIDVIKGMPVDRLLIETDAPYLSPEPFRGKLNEPKHVTLTYKFISESLGYNLEEFTNIIAENFNRLFKR